MERGNFLEVKIYVSFSSFSKFGGIRRDRRFITKRTKKEREGEEERRIKTSPHFFALSCSRLVNLGCYIVALSS